MSGAVVFGLCGAALVAIGLYGLVAAAHLVRRIICFNLMGSGAFLLFGALGRRGPEGVADPTPQAMIITGIVVALSLTAVALALAARLESLERHGAPPEADDRENA